MNIPQNHYSIMSSLRIYALSFVTRTKNENRIHSIRFMKYGGFMVS